METNNRLINKLTGKSVEELIKSKVYFCDLQYGNLIFKKNSIFIFLDSQTKTVTICALQNDGSFKDQAQFKLK